MKFVLVHEGARQRAVEAVRNAPPGHEVLVKEPTRNSEQNAKLWALLTDISQQVEWYGRKLDTDSWKHIFSAALKRQQTVPGLDGGFVVLGAATSRMTKREFSDLLELIQSFGAERGVQWSDEAVAA